MPYIDDMIAQHEQPKYRQAIASMSLGRAWAHELPAKLDQAKKYGYEGVELYYEDLEYVARSIDEQVGPQALMQAAHIIRKLCDDRELEIIALQPFMHYEGLRDRKRHAQRINEMKVWLDLMPILGSDLIEIPSTFLDESETTGDLDVIVADFREVAELGAKRNPPIKFAYESLCWGTHVDTWEQSWEIVQMVDRPNFGIVLDTFNIAGRVYADPADPSGKTPNADADMEASIQRMVKTIDVRKVFFVQLADAERLEEAIAPGHKFYDPSQPSRMSWSRNCRLFYGEGYLPVKEIGSAILKDIGYTGWISFELFNKFITESRKDVPENMAKRGAQSFRKFCADLELKA